jgi:hypothetical protein
MFINNIRHKWINQRTMYGVVVDGSIEWFDTINKARFVLIIEQSIKG